MRVPKFIFKMQDNDELMVAIHPEDGVGLTTGSFRLESIATADFQLAERHGLLQVYVEPNLFKLSRRGRAQQR